MSEQSIGEQHKGANKANQIERAEVGGRQHQEGAIDKLHQSVQSVLPNERASIYNQVSRYDARAHQDSLIELKNDGQLTVKPLSAETQKAEKNSQILNFPDPVREAEQQKAAEEAVRKTMTPEQLKQLDADMVRRNDYDKKWDSEFERNGGMKDIKRALAFTMGPAHHEGDIRTPFGDVPVSVDNFYKKVNDRHGDKQ